MTTLDAIGFTTAGSSLVAIFTFIWFALAVRAGSHKVAPRCTARSSDTVFNPKARRKKKIGASVVSFFRRSFIIEKDSKKDDDFSNVGASAGAGFEQYNDDEEDKNPIHVQYRGGPMFGWIRWTMSLSYEQLLNGVPGTGTRKNGMEGSMLKVNLDGIVLLRFHDICLRVALVGTILAMIVVLPINLTANCIIAEGKFECYSTAFTTNLTNYEMTTIENIPVLKISGEQANEFSWWNAIFGASLKIFGSNYGAFLGRLYAIVGVSWILILYVLRLLRKEWAAALALRRVFYLEGKHWKNRIDELYATGLNDDDDDDDDDEKEDLEPGSLRNRRLINKGKKGIIKKKKKKTVVDKRPPWIPHPEQRDTVPNIELYSVLVGQIPSAPIEIDEDNDEQEAVALDLRNSIDWQLRVTTTFFDQCVPNQPGFSSSVAAVSMLPDAPKLAEAWRAWYRHCAMLRRLRFVRELINKKRHYDIEEFNDDDKKEEPINKDDIMIPNEMEQPPDSQLSGSQDYLDEDFPNAEISEQQEYNVIQKRIQYYSNVFGTDFNEHLLPEDENYIQDNQDTEKKLLSPEQLLMGELLSYGPEQTAVYSKEFARGGASCCPNGCREEKMREQYNLRELEELKDELEVLFDEAYQKLINIQKQMVISSYHKADDKVEENKKKSSEDDVEGQLFSRTPTKYTASDGHPASYDAGLLSNGDHRHEMYEGNRPEIDIHTNQLLPISPIPLNSNFRPPLSPHPESFNYPAGPPSVQTDKSIPLTISNQGKIHIKGFNTAGSHASDVEGVAHFDSSGIHVQQDGDSLVNDQNSMHLVSTRRRADTGITLRSHQRDFDRKTNWQKVNEAVQDNQGTKETRISSGVWKMPSISDFLLKIWKKIRFPFKRTIDAVDEINSITSFAIVTFTSRQAAVAARHCLSDGRGMGRWTAVQDIPVPPLADAAICDICDCRGCCKPVTLTIHPKQQLIRHYAALGMLACIFVFYTIPLTFAGALVAPEKLENLFPGIEEAANDNILLNNILSGILPAIFYSIFFALCPIMFKTLSNFGSNAVSVNQAEFIALQYYWWFMLTTAFAGTSLTTMALAFFNAKENEEANFQSLFLSVAATLPTQVSATWLNWIIFRTFCTLPMMYMLNIHTFIFQLLGWKCCMRCVMGGGPGGPVPYRIYIDSGVVFMCVVCLTPISPLLAPAALCYFLFCAPLWRRNCIYMYRPQFDTGGIRWPFLSDVMISACCVAQVLLTTTMALKQALGPAILSGVILIPVYLHRKSTRKKYLRSYMDAALLQTSQLDGWDNTTETSKNMREEYRKFLVDAHRAAYIPICLAGDEARGLTNEPAVVVPHPNDVLEPTPLQTTSDDFDQHEQDQSIATPMSGYPGYYPMMTRNRVQNGASFRRVQMGNSFADESMGELTRPPSLIHQTIPVARSYG